MVQGENNANKLLEGTEEELTPEQLQAVKGHIAALQRQFADFEERDTTARVKEVQKAKAGIDEDVARALLSSFGNNELELASLLSQEGDGPDSLLAAGRDLAAEWANINAMEHGAKRKEAERRMRKTERHVRLLALGMEPEDYESSDEEEEEQATQEEGHQPAPQPKPKKKGSGKREESMQEESYGVRFVRQLCRKSPGQRLRLDDALQRADTMEGWSEARKGAWRERHTKPNTYYYRFNDPGQPQREGKWNAEEQAAFFRRLEEWLRIHEGHMSYQWGLFARPIYGRVGYQCSNFYRALVKHGMIRDPNYTIDARGDLRFRFKHRGFKRGPQGRLKDPSTPPSTPEQKARKAGVRPENRILATDEPERPADDAGEAPSQPQPKQAKQPSKKAPKGGKKASSTSKGKKGAEKDKEFQCSAVPTLEARPSRSGTKRRAATSSSGEESPLPGFIDPITKVQVEDPYISPYGHVLGYDTWCRILQNNGGSCPFTKQRLTRRQLEPVTHDNVDRMVEAQAPDWDAIGDALCS